MKTRTEFDWNDGAYVPDEDCYCLCEIDWIWCVPYMVCKWSKGDWWVANPFTHSWLKAIIRIKRWCLIEEINYDNTRDV